MISKSIKSDARHEIVCPPKFFHFTQVKDEQICWRIMPTLPEALLLWSNDTNSSVLQSILSDHANLLRVRRANQIQSAPCDHRFDVVLCGWSVREGTSSGVLELVRHQLPDVPVLTFCHPGSEREWLQLLEARWLRFTCSVLLGTHGSAVLEDAITFGESRRNHTVLAPQGRKAT